MRSISVWLIAFALLAGCSKHKPPAEQHGPVEVTVMTVTPRDTPVSSEYVGQTESSHQVEIRARVSGFLDRRVYTEGSTVKAGQVLFQQDPRPFEVQLKAAEGALAEEKARLRIAEQNLAQVQPLAERKALSQKDLDDAIGQRDAAAAAVQTAQANVDAARLNLSYTTITSPVTGLSSYARVQEGAYVSPENSLLTYVEQVDPVWVNFTLSENEMLAYRQQAEKGTLRLPPKGEYKVELILADGSTYAHPGRITFANANYDSQTGSYLLRATLPNSEGALRPGEFVRVRVSGPVRVDAVLVPQEAVLQGAKGHFVVVVDQDGKAQIRPVQVGAWQGDNWFIDAGLSAGDVVVTDGVARLSPGTPVKATEPPAQQATAPAAGAQ
jgi:membrane fusion protein (multidrug efflux system)